MPTMKRNILAVSLLTLIGLTATGCGSGDKPQQAGMQMPPPEVGVVEIKPQEVALTTELPGRTVPYLVAEVRPQVKGIILERPFREGGEVKKGQTLYQIDPATYQAIYDSALATVSRDEAVLKSAELKLQRYKKLVKIKAVSQENYDDADAALKQAKATLAMDKAALESARINLDYTRVTAPIAGRIGRSSVTQGALVTADQAQALATIQQIDPIYVDMTQSVNQVMRLKKELNGDAEATVDDAKSAVSLKLEDGSTYPHPGKLQFSEITVDEATGSVTLRAEFPNPDHALLPGMYVRAVVQESVEPRAILVPQEGVTHDPKGNATAMVLNAENKVEPRQLTVDRAIDNQWLVTKGLETGDRVIVSGLQKIRPGAEARVAAPADATAPANGAKK